MTRKVTKKAAATFMQQLLAPLPDAELRDVEISKLEAKAAKEEQGRAEARFFRMMKAVEAARYRWHALSCYRQSLESPAPELATQCDAKKHEYFNMVERLIRTPAPSMKHVKAKEKLLKVGGREEIFEPIIRAEKAKLSN